MLTKEKVLETIQQIPDDKFNDIDNIIEEIILLEKIEKALEDVKNGEVYTPEEVNKIISEW